MNHAPVTARVQVYRHSLTIAMTLGWFLVILFCIAPLRGAPTWQEWASGLPSGVYPKMCVAPNHDIYVGLLGTGSTKGLVYRASTRNSHAVFEQLPQIPLPASTTNNIQILVCNARSEVIAGIFRSNSSEPFLFRFDVSTQQWKECTVDLLPNLGAFCAARSPDGTLWIGTKWSYIYRSVDDGLSFQRIDETPLVQHAYPCYYPAWSGNPSDGAIYSINVDHRGRVYAGTEGAGIIYSDDNGLTWHPADLFACQTDKPETKDSASPMIALSRTGNLGAIGFTNDNDLVFNGTSLWSLNWTTALGFASMQHKTSRAAEGFVPYFISTGLQVTTIVTTANGRLFLHSGSTSGVMAPVGVYTSFDGIQWSFMPDQPSSFQSPQAQGSLCVDGNMVFMATTDGDVYTYDASTETSSVGAEGDDTEKSSDVATVICSDSWMLPSATTNRSVSLVSLEGRTVLRHTLRDGETLLNLRSVVNGVYVVLCDGHRYRIVISH